MRKRLEDLPTRGQTKEILAEKVAEIKAQETEQKRKNQVSPGLDKALQQLLVCAATASEALEYSLGLELYLFEQLKQKTEAAKVKMNECGCWSCQLAYKRAEESYLASLHRVTRAYIVPDEDEIVQDFILWQRHMEELVSKFSISP